jgi:putative membrane protein
VRIFFKYLASVWFFNFNNPKTYKLLFFFYFIIFLICETMKKITLNVALALFVCLVSACETKRETTEETTTTTTTEEMPADENVGMEMPQDTTSIVTGKPGVPIYNSDAEFVAMAASGGMMEVELGKVAAQKASNAEVKKYGQQMVTDHGKANDELKSLASKKNWVRPANMLPDHQATFDRISKLSGKDFDRDYMAQMVLDHETDVAMFEQATQKATDTDLKAWTSKTLPTLRSHLDMARNINSKVK